MSTNGIRRVCLLGNVAKDSKIVQAAESFDLPVVQSDNVHEYLNDTNCTTIFVLESFEGDVYNTLYKSKQPLLGPPALQELANQKKPLPKNTRPLFNLSMTGVVVCFTGFRNKDDLVRDCKHVEKNFN